MQYTVEHIPAQSSLLGVQPDLYKNIYIVVDDDEAEMVEQVLGLQRYGIVVRESTKEEVQHVWDMDADLECHDPDTARHWPEEEAEIVLEIKDW